MAISIIYKNPVAKPAIDLYVGQVINFRKNCSGIEFYRLLQAAPAKAGRATLAKTFGKCCSAPIIAC